MGQRRRCVVRLAGTAETASGSLYTLADDEAHHLRDVLRLPVGSEVHLVDRGGLGTFRSELITTQGNVTVKILERLPISPLRSKVRTLAFGLSKGEKNDLVCEKACELGAESIIIWQGERSIPQLDPDNTRKKSLRFQKILESASAQCGREDIPPISVVPSLRAALALIKQSQSSGDRTLTLSLAKDAQPFTVLATAPGVHLVIGPEGDFSPNEESSLDAHGAVRVSLGPLTLRCETAAIAAVASINAVWGFVDSTSDRS